MNPKKKMPSEYIQKLFDIIKSLKNQLKKLLTENKIYLLILKSM